jgi:hypothetical protein
VERGAWRAEAQKAESGKLKSRKQESEKQCGSLFQFSKFQISHFFSQAQPGMLRAGGLPAAENPLPRTPPHLCSWPQVYILATQLSREKIKKNGPRRGRRRPQRVNGFYRGIS